MTLDVSEHNVVQEDTPDGTFIKKMMCPVCKKDIDVVTVKKSAIRIEDRESDFNVKYKGVNPLIFEVIACGQCGYASSISNFDNVNPMQIRSIKENITSNWVKRSFNNFRSIDDAIYLFKLLLLNLSSKSATSGEEGIIYLKLSWLYRAKGSHAMEKAFQGKALEFLERAYLEESFPIAGLDEHNMLYLIGELSRRTGNDEKAIKIFSELMVIKYLDKRLKERVRAQKELIIEERKMAV